MASAVQTKKKRDKKKRKEDGPEEFLPQPPTVTSTVADDLNIHIYKEATTGGGLCAKLVFFALLTILSTLIGLIITEHRGLTDLDTVNTESAFAHIFEGWIDKFPETHEQEETLSVEHSQEDEDDEAEHSHSSHYDNDEDDDKELSEEHESQTVSDEEKESEYSATQEQEDDDEEENQEDEDELETQGYEGESATQEELETESITQEEPEMDSTTPEEEEILENPETAEESENTEENSAETEKYESDVSNENQEDEVPLTSQLRREDSQSKAEHEDDNESKEEEGDINIPVDYSVKEEPEQMAEEVDESEKEGSNMVIRFGVGTALLVVAHVVLIKKWRSAKISIKPPEGGTDEDQAIGIDLSRRDTLVSPPSLQNIGQDFEEPEEDYSEEEDSYVKEDSTLNSSVLRQEYQQLRSVYSHNLSPEWVPEKRYDYSEEEEEEQDVEDVEEDCEEEEEEEEIERSEEDDDIISENEDAELLRRLQERYGALQQDEDEDEEDDQDEEEDEEELDEDGEEYGGRSTDYDHWKREKFVPIEDSNSEDENNWSNRKSGAQMNYDFSNITNTNDWKIREELDRAGQNLRNE